MPIDHRIKKHITAVKKLWRRSNEHHTLGQILQTNQHHSQLVPTRKPEGCYLYHTRHQMSTPWIVDQRRI
ncbi:hypothetical protein BDN67DRAFT_689323 [Paxillus ammoniavirescens]|nr:hypothetical protein BDN67DRAFT_689323 [Paxillus ammoniavirescens]